jgi:GNAT superfamily N-acetyltransferase
METGAEERHRISCFTGPILLGTGAHFVKIVDLTQENEDCYFHCLEEWSDEMKESDHIKKAWYQRIKGKDLIVKLALDDRNTVGGMIQYLPIEESFIQGKDLFFVLCIWVHGYKKGRGNFQGQGMGRSLLQAAEEDARSRGARGMAAWGIGLPFWMKASWFRKHGYEPIDHQGLGVLLFKPFTADATPPRWFRPAEKPGGYAEDKICVTAFVNGWCPAQNLTHERARRACEGFVEEVTFRTIDTLDRHNLEKWGIPDGVYINGKKIGWGPPVSYEKIKKKIARQVNRKR